ncbi:unnamed protein product [Candidula unifasciata]|uniref:NXPE C-terminal domain-containing protein n=1 Tax=Candidula unifasciata TaxID=100452 RepID=A0A8S3ZAU4_9EUPU|nr:unnamed protein product [Candidula unifasciata]
MPDLLSDTIMQFTWAISLTRNSSTKIPCNKISPQTTWTQEIPTGHFSGNNWYPRFCAVPQLEYAKCFQNKQVLILGDSNGRSHYYNIVKHSKCTEVVKAVTKRWHKPLLCAHKTNNFTLSWSPHTNPFMNGVTLDEIPSHGHYLIILNHFYHLTVSHISVSDFLFRNIKDALVRLFQRNPNVQVVLQGPHIAWFGWPEHYAAGDMLGTHIMDLQQEIFQDVKDKMLFISHWDMTMAKENYDYHPGTNGKVFDLIVGLTCGR